MVIKKDMDDEIRKKIEDKTKDPVRQELLKKLIQENPDLTDLFLKIDNNNPELFDKIKSGSINSMSSSPVTQRDSYRPASGTPFSTSSSPISTGGSGSGGGCFIATAVYDSPLANNVLVLSSFRDQYLCRSSYGRAFIGLYYRYSPRIARYISDKQLIKKVVRLFLKPVIWLCQHIVIDESIY
jgi:hypothetical protein